MVRSLLDRKLLGQVVRIVMDTVATWYRRRYVQRGLPTGQFGAVAVIQRSNSDLRLNARLHSILLDGPYAPDHDGKDRCSTPRQLPPHPDPLLTRTWGEGDGVPIRILWHLPPGHLPPGARMSWQQDKSESGR